MSIQNISKLENWSNCDICEMLIKKFYVENLRA